MAENLRKQGASVVIAGFHGHTSPSLAEHADAFTLLKLGKLGKLASFLKKHNVGLVCMAGAISKPKALNIRPDWQAVKLLLTLKHKGDDMLLRALAAFMEERGMRVVQAADLAPQLRGPTGVLTQRQPTAEEWADLRLGWKVAKTTGALDIGQTVVVKKGVVAAVEALEGTDNAIRRGTKLAGKGAVVVKTVKPGQDERIDLPALGKDTLMTLITGQGACLGYEAQKTLFFDLGESLKLAEKHKIAIVGLSAEDTLDD